MRALLGGSVVSLLDSHCDGHGAEGGRVGGRGRNTRPPTSAPSEEVGTAYDVVVARRGAYAREVGGRTVLAHPGSVTFWHPGEVYRITHPLPGGDVCSIFRLSPAGARALLAEHDPRLAEREVPRFPVLEAPLAGPAYLHHRLALAAAATGAAALAAEEHATAFLHAVLAGSARGAVARRGDDGGGGMPPCAPPTTRGPRRESREARNRYGAEYAARAREVIAARFREPLTLAGVAAAVGCSPYHLSRIMSAHTGVSIYRLVVQLRLRDALERVLGTRDSLSAVALDAGFASQSHFGDAFRREFGCAPGAARRRGLSGTVRAAARRR